MSRRGAAAVAVVVLLALPAIALTDLRKWNPDTLFDTRDFRHVGVSIDMNRNVFIPAVSPVRPGKRLGPDVPIAEQTRRALANLSDALAAAGATPDDVISLHYFVTDYRFMDGIAVGREARAFFRDRVPVSSFIPVQGLVWPHARIQIDAQVDLKR